MTIRNLQEITNLNTFGQWKVRTNEIIQALDAAVTLGDNATADNDGILYIQGSITTEDRVFTDIIEPLDNASNLVDIQSDSRVEGLFFNTPIEGRNNLIQIMSSSNIGLASAKTWRLGVGDQHDDFIIAGRHYVSDQDIVDSELTFTRATSVEGETVVGTISGTNILIDDAILPAELSYSNANSATKWKTARTITFGNGIDPVTSATLYSDVTGSITLDGTQNLTIQLQVVDDSHRHDGADGYYTKEYSDQFFSRIDDSNSAYIRTIPDSLETVSVVSAHGFKMNDDVLIYMGDSSDATVGFDGSSLAVRQGVGSISIAAGSSILFRKWSATGADVNKIKFDMGTGAITAEGDITAFGSASDRRLKENITKIEGALDKVTQMAGYTFNYIGNDTPMTGVMADEVEAVLPEVVYEVGETNSERDEVPGYKAVRYGNMVGLLIEAIKELKAEVDALKTRGS